jgi:hypothetical protein
VLGRGIASSVGTVIGEAVPALSPLYRLATAIACALVIAYGISVVLAWRKRVVLAVLTPAIFFALCGLASQSYPLDWILVSIVTLGTTVILWRFGLFAAIVALYVFLSVDSVITLVAVADTSKMLSALVAALIVAGPGILGVIAYRRLRATAA